MTENEISYKLIIEIKAVEVLALVHYALGSETRVQGLPWGLIPFISKTLKDSIHRVVNNL